MILHSLVPAIFIGLLWVWVTTRPMPVEVPQPQDMARQISAILYLALGLIGSAFIWLIWLTYELSLLA